MTCSTFFIFTHQHLHSVYSTFLIIRINGHIEKDAVLERDGTDHGVVKDTIDEFAADETAFQQAALVERALFKFLFGNNLTVHLEPLHLLPCILCVRICG